MVDLRTGGVDRFFCWQKNGAFDMAGDVWQWNEANFSGSFRGLRGGSVLDYTLNLASSDRNLYNPTVEDSIIGFRVASIAAVPEPSTFALLGAGLVGLVGYGWRKRKQAA